MKLIENDHIIFNQLTKFSLLKTLSRGLNCQAKSVITDSDQGRA